MKPTIKNVAEKAGVSFKTVSRVINNEASVTDTVRERVWKAIKELGYTPNISARQLRGASSFIGFIYDNPNSHYIIDMQRGILQTCRDQGFELVIHPCDSKAPDLIDEIISITERNQLAGLVLAPPISETPEIIDALTQKNIHFVRVISASQAPDDASPCIYIDDRQAAFNITQHLLVLGHTDIAFLSGDIGHASTTEREAGYTEALLAHKMAADPKRILPGSYSFESGVERTEALLSGPQPPTAIFACNDEIAAGTLFAARLKGVRVPTELAIAGFEDSPFSQQTWPKLTTSRQPTRDIASSATVLLLETAKRIKSSPPKKTPSTINHQGFLPTLLIRESTQPSDR